MTKSGSYVHLTEKISKDLPLSSVSNVDADCFSMPYKRCPDNYLP